MPRLVGVLPREGHGANGRTAKWATGKVGESFVEEVWLVLKREIVASHRKWGLGSVPTLDWENNVLVDLIVKVCQFSSKVFTCGMK